MQKNCDSCGKPATHKIVKVVNGEIEEHYFCSEHASGTQGILAQPHLQVSLEELLKSLLSQASAAAASASTPEEEAQNADLKCGACGLPFPLYRKTMILGCDSCYESFRPLLLADLRKFHGAIRHVGMRPPRFVSSPSPVFSDSLENRGPQAADFASEAGAAVAPKPSKKQDLPTVLSPEEKIKRLESLRRDMSEAVKTEDFEKAARLRDTIRELEN